MAVSAELVTRLLSFSNLVAADFDSNGVSHRFDYCHPAWVCAWAKYYVPSSGWRESIGMLSVFRGDRFLGGLGLGRQRALGFDVASLGGYYWPYRTACSMVDVDEFGEVSRILARTLKNVVSSRLVRLGPVSSEDPFLGLLLDQLKNNGWSVLRKKIGSSYCINLPNTFEQFSTGASSSLVKNVAYQTRRLSKLDGGFAASRFTLSDMKAEHFDDLSKIEAGSWLAGTGGDLKFSRVCDKNFWQFLAEKPIADQRVVFWMLYVGGEPTAYSAQIESSDCVYIFANGYLECRAQYSPGAVLSAYIFKDLIGRGAKFVDWGMGDSGYKARWGARPLVDVFDYLLFRANWLGSGLRCLPKSILKNWELV